MHSLIDGFIEGFQICFTFRSLPSLSTTLAKSTGYPTLLLLLFAVGMGFVFYEMGKASPLFQNGNREGAMKKPVAIVFITLFMIAFYPALPMFLPAIYWFGCVISTFFAFAIGRSIIRQPIFGFGMILGIISFGIAQAYLTPETIEGIALLLLMLAVYLSVRELKALNLPDNSRALTLRIAVCGLVLTSLLDPSTLHQCLAHYTEEGLDTLEISTFKLTMMSYCPGLGWIGGMLFAIKKPNRGEPIHITMP